jgi:hypothetical protein
MFKLFKISQINQKYQPLFMDNGYLMEAMAQVYLFGFINQPALPSIFYTPLYLTMEMFNLSH